MSFFQSQKILRSMAVFSMLLLATTALFVAAVLTSTSHVHAQQAATTTAVQNTATRSDASTICVSSNTSSGTITFTPPAGQYVYVSEIDFENGQSTTGVAAAAAPTNVTISNITGAPVWNMASGAATTPGTNTQSFSVLYPSGLKSTTPGTVVTITLPAIITNQFLRVNACAYFAQ